MGVCRRWECKIVAPYVLDWNAHALGKDGNLLPARPREQVYALWVDVGNLQPWEFDAMDVDLYDQIVHLHRVYAREAKRQREAAGKPSP